MNNFSKSIAINGNGNILFSSNTGGTITQYELTNNQWTAKDSIVPSVSSIQYVGEAKIVSLACNQDNTLLSATIKNDYNIYVLIFEYDGASWGEVFDQQLDGSGLTDSEVGVLSINSGQNYIAVTNINSGQKFLQIIKKQNNIWAFDITLGDDAYGKINTSGEAVFLVRQGNAVYSGSIDGPTFPEIKVANIKPHSSRILAINGDGNICAIEEGSFINFYKRKDNKWGLYFSRQKQSQQKIKKLLINKNGSRFAVSSVDTVDKVEVFQIEDNNVSIIDKPLLNQNLNTKGNFAEDFDSDEDMSIVAVSEEDVGISVFEVQVQRKIVKIVDVEYDFGDSSWFAKEAYKLNDGDFPVDEKGILLTNEKRIILVNQDNSQIISYFPAIEKEKSLFKKRKQFTNKYNFNFTNSSQPFEYEINWYYQSEKYVVQGEVNPLNGQVELSDVNNLPVQRDRIEGLENMFQKFIPVGSESDENISPWGTRAGIYEFINSITIDEFKASDLIKRKNQYTNNTSSSEFCQNLTNKKIAGYCKPKSISGKANIHPDGFLNKNNLYGKNFIESAVALDTRVRKDFFYDMTINSFWKNFITLIKEQNGLLIYEYNYNTDTHEWRLLERVSNGFKAKILSDDLVEFLEDNLGSIPSIAYSENYCEENNIEYLGGLYDGVPVLDVQAFAAKVKLLEGRSGYNNPYIGYNQDGHFIQRRLIFMPIKKAIFIDEEDPKGIFEDHTDRFVQEIDEYIAVVEWSVSYSDVFGKKNDPPIYKRYYDINEKFFYRGSNYNVYGNFPFMDFNMSPIRWSEQKTKYILKR